MIINDICPFKGETMCVELVGGELPQPMKIYINSSVVSGCGLKKGMEISTEQADEIIYKNDLRRARERALYLAGSREHSYSEMYDKLMKNYPEEICCEVCDMLSEKGIIDDRRYAEKLCRQLFEVKKLGEYRVKQEMRRRGIPREIIDEVTEKFSEEDDPYTRLMELVERKYARYLDDENGVRKVTGALVRKGYSYSEVREVLRDFMEED